MVAEQLRRDRRDLLVPAAVHTEQRLGPRRGDILRIVRLQDLLPPGDVERSCRAERKSREAEYLTTTRGWPFDVVEPSQFRCERKPCIRLD